MKKLLLAALLLSGALLTQTTSVLDKNVLYQALKGDFHMMLGVMRKDWMALAQQNPQLAYDLEKLYSSFRPNNEQPLIDAFCQKWELPSIKIEE